MLQILPITKTTVTDDPSDYMTLNQWKHMVLNRMVGEENAARLQASRPAIRSKNRQVTRQIDFEIEASVQKALTQSER